MLRHRLGVDESEMRTMADTFLIEVFCDYHLSTIFVESISRCDHDHDMNDPDVIFLRSIGFVCWIIPPSSSPFNFP